MAGLAMTKGEEYKVAKKAFDAAEKYISENACQCDGAPPAVAEPEKDISEGVANPKVKTTKSDASKAN